MLNKIKVASKIIESVVFVFLLCILATVVSPYLPFKNVPKSYIVVTGSMEPTIKTGSIAFTNQVDPKSIVKGDIIAFTSPNNQKDTILHRVESIKSTDPLLFSTKGDANNAADLWDVTTVGIKGKLFYSLPYLGHIGAFVKKPIGFSLVIGLPALLYIISQLINIKKAINEEIDRKVKETVGHRKKTATKVKYPTTNLVISFFIFSSLIGLSTIGSIRASYSDLVKVEGISISIKDFVPPSTPAGLRWTNPSVSCGGFTNSQTITADWDNSIDNIGVLRYEYEVTYPKLGGGIGVWQTIVPSSSYAGVFNQAEGLHTYRVRAYDAEGNVSGWSTSCTITYDKTVPDSVITSPYNSNSDNIIAYVYLWNGRVQGNASDTHSGIDHVELSIHREISNLYWNGSSWVSGTESGTRVIATGTTSWTYDFYNNPPLGKFKIISHAVDKAGNVENSATIEFENVEPLSIPEVTVTPTATPTPTVAPLPQLMVALTANHKDNKINLTVSNVSSPFDYEILYSGNGVEKGISGHASQDKIADSKFTAEYYLGTCSTGGTCTPEDVLLNSIITVNLTGGAVITQNFNY